MEFFDLKAKLLVEGLAVDGESLAGLGSAYKEQNHGLFGWDFEDHPGRVLPDDFRLPDGTIVQFRLNSSSPYQVRIHAQETCLFAGQEKICKVEWIDRPSFYDKTTSDTPMVKIGQIGGEDCLFFCYQNYCTHFSRHRQCLFCNLVSTSKTYDSVLKKKDVESIGEVAEAAWSEGTVKHVLLTGGCFNYEREVRLVTDILDAIKRHTGFDQVPGTILPSPAKGDAIAEYFASGIAAVGYSMEIWDEKLYAAICPGKAESTSHEVFVRSIKTAVNVFGAGNVYGVFVMGLEPKDTLLDGIRALSEAGANIVPFVWSPNPGSRLAGHRAPCAQWYSDVTQEAAEIVSASGVPSGTQNHCFRCDGNSLLHDALRQRGVA